MGASLIAVGFTGGALAMVIFFMFWVFVEAFLSYEVGYCLYFVDESEAPCCRVVFSVSCSWGFSDVVPGWEVKLMVLGEFGGIEH